MKVIIPNLKLITKSLLGGFLLTSSIGKTASDTNANAMANSKCLTSSPAPISKEFVGYWKDSSKQNSIELFIEIGNGGEMSFIFDTSYFDDSFPKTIVYLQNKTSSEASVKPSCEYLDYQKQSGKSEAEIEKDLQEMSSSVAKIENNTFITSTASSKQTYEKANSQAVEALKEKIKQNKIKREAVINNQVVPLVGKRFLLQKTTYITTDQNGQSTTSSQDANQIKEEYSCGSTEKPKTCFNAKSFQILSTKKALINGKLDAKVNAYLKDSTFNLENDGISLSIKESETTSLWVVSGTVKVEGNALTMTSTGTYTDGKKYTTINYFSQY